MQRKYTVIYLHRSMYEYISVQIFSHDTQKDKKREKFKKKINPDCGKTAIQIK